ncbi:MAG TPA: hypothetical protein VF624_00020 [Tepidisphaeraceae bacterium]
MRRFCLPVLALLLLAALASDRAHAQATVLKFDDKGQPLPVDRAESRLARQALIEAKARLADKTAATILPSAAAVENGLWQNGDYRRAMLAFRRAQADYDNARRPIFDALRQETYYRELEKKTEESQRVIKALRVTGRGNFDHLFPQAMTALQFRTRMTRAEIIAMAQTPEVEDARLRMLEAAARVRAVRQQQTGGFSAATLRDAKAAADVARDNVKDAQAAYARTLAAEAEYERQRLKWLADNLQNAEKK